MRTIKFRGKRTSDWEWIYGDLITFGGDECEICDCNTIDYSRYDVDYETIGQLQCIYKGTKLYVGDIVKVWNTIEYGSVEQAMADEAYSVSVIDELGFVNIPKYEYEQCHIQCLSDVGFEIEILGNIHDNPELLTEK